MKYALTEYKHPYRDFYYSPDLFQARQFISQTERFARIGKEAVALMEQNGSLKMHSQSDPNVTFWDTVSHAFANCYRMISFIGGAERQDPKEYAQVTLLFLYKGKKKPFVQIEALVNLRTGSSVVKSEIFS